MARFLPALLLLSYSVTLASSTYAQQEYTRLTVKSPTGAKETDLKITSVECTSEFTGNRVTNTYYFTFLNEFDRQLEGNLEFPLGEGENVVRFALDINGKMREGVVVDKNKGQKVFEDIERRRVDPALLEKTKGNNYRARVFPIPAKGTRQIMITTEKIIPIKFQEEINVEVPLMMNAKIKNFTLKIIVNGESREPQLKKNDLVSQNFTRKEWTWISENKKENILVNTTIVYTIPKDGSGQKVFTQKSKKGDGYFFSATVFVPDIKPVKKNPSSVLIVWDNSFSGMQRHTEKEIQFLKEYFALLKNAEVKVVTCNIQSSSPKTFKISGGNTEQLVHYLRSLPFDGATQLGTLDLSSVKADEILLVSDGISSFGEEEIKFGKIPVYSIVSGTSSDFSYLGFVSSASGGKMINLATLEMKEALNEISTPAVSLYGYTSDVTVNDVYYDIHCKNGYGFTLSGISSSNDFDLSLQFGIPGQILHTETISFSRENEISGSNVVERMWALQKLNRLLPLPEKNKEKIISHSTKYSIVSPFTSLIVLDEIRDYVHYEITPPEELMNEYKAMAESMKKEKDSVTEKRIQKVEEMYSKKLNWWQTDYYDTIAGIKAKKLVEEEAARWKIVLEKKEKELDSMKNLYEEALRQVELREQTIDSLKQKITGLQNTIDSLRDPVAYNRKQELLRKNELKKEDFLSIEANKIMLSDVQHYREALHYSAMRDQNASMLDEKSKLKAFELEGKPEIKLEEWKSDAPYIEKLSKVADAELYNEYLKLRKDYLYVAPFYLDVGEYMIKRGKQEWGLLVFSNIAELRYDDFAMMRVLAHRILQSGETKHSIEMFRKVAKLRPEEPQTWRDLGLALARDKQYQAAIDTLYKVIEEDWNDRFPEIEAIVLTEMNNIISTCGQKLDLSRIDSRFIGNMTAATRVVICWDTDNCDIDLWVTEPTGEKCYYSHPLTAIGGRLSRDFTRGYGPEEYMLHYTLEGNYLVEANYYGQSAMSVIGPSTIVIQIYTDYGKPTQKMQEIVRRLSTGKEVIKIGDVVLK